MKAIADTGFIVAFGNQADHHHVWALNVAKNITEPLLTCEAVLAEAAFHLGSTSYVLSLVRNDLLRLSFEISRNLQPLAELARRYEDRRPDPCGSLALFSVTVRRRRDSGGVKIVETKVFSRMSV